MNRKSAFTLTEVLITLLIIGIVATFAFSTIKKVDKNVKYIYANTYHSLDRALYNGSYYSDSLDPFEENISDNDGRVRLCMLLTEYINYSQRTCNATNITDSGNLGDSAPDFVSQNGVKFYISKKYPEVVNNSNPHTFYIVYADVNGDKQPNSMEYAPNNPNQDIFAFAALDIRRVCPLGSPEVDPRFMTTRITYYKEENEQITERFTTTSKPYYLTKAEAWGYYLQEDKLNDDFYIEDNPFTYNGYVRKNIADNSLIYSFLNGAQLSVPDGVTLKSGTVEENGYNCVKGSDAECDLIVDKYLY